MTTTLIRPRRLLRAALALLVLAAGNAAAVINGVTGAPGAPVFNLTAKHDIISTADGNSHYTWGYANGNGRMQYPGPTMIVKQGDVVTINLKNTLPVPVSIVFPGQQGVTASGGSSGTLTNEVGPGTLGSPAGPVTYTFVASQPGTYLYHSGTHPSLQIDMGLIGSIVVRPNVPGQAYNQPGTAFDREYLFLLSEMDPLIHQQVYNQVTGGQPVAVDTTTFHPTIWFINGRNAPDTMQDAGVPWLPTQPYNCLPRMHPGEKLLMRVVDAGRDLHPFHHHGNHAIPIARDGRVLESAPGIGPDLSSPDFTVRSIPGQTMDLIFEWTGKNLGWDVYGHSPGDPLQPGEDADSHGKPVPVTLPNLLDHAYGPYYTGSPFLGQYGVLPPGTPALNITGGHFHMWHSHNEKEVTTDDIFPGGMMTMLVIEAPTVPIP